MLETLRKFLFRHEEGQPESSAILAYAWQGVNKGWDVLRAVMRSFPWGGILRGKLSWGDRWFLWAVTWGGLFFVLVSPFKYFTLNMLWILFLSFIFLLVMRKSWWRILLIPVILSPVLVTSVLLMEGARNYLPLPDEARIEAGLQIEESLVAINPDYKKRSEDNLRLKKVINNLCELKLLFTRLSVRKNNKCFGASITLEDYENPIIRKIAYDVLRDPCPYYKAIGDKGRDLNKNYKAAVKKRDKKIAYNKKFGYPTYRDIDETPLSTLLATYQSAEREGSWLFKCDQPVWKRNAPIDRYLNIITPEGGGKIVRILHIAPDGETSIGYFDEAYHHYFLDK